MTTKHLRGAHPNGYTLSRAYTALIIDGGATVGGTGVLAVSKATVHNFGAVTADGSSYGMVLGAGGAVTNGSSGQTQSLISGYGGVLIQGGPAKVANYGTISALGHSGGVIVAGYAGVAASVTNGSAADTTALIEGPAAGVWLAGGPAVVANFGTISGRDGILLSGRGAATLTNGSADDTTATIQGGLGGVVSRHASEKVFNFGTISGSAYGLDLGGRATVTNGSAADAKATISGANAGIDALGASETIINFGAISGSGRTAVRFRSSSDLLRVEAGCVFQGAVLGGGARLDLASGVGVISHMTNHRLTVSGSMAATTFSHFGTLVITRGARFTLAGRGAIGARGPHTLVDNGLVTVARALTVSGTLAGTGTVALSSGAAMTLGGAAPAFLTVAFRGNHATLALMDPAAFAATIAGFAITDTIDLLGLAATSAKIGRDDTLTVSDGLHAVATLQMAGNYAGMSFTTMSDGHGGTDIIVTADRVAPPDRAAPHAFIAAAAAFGAPGPAAHAASPAHADGWRSLIAAPRLSIA